MSRLEGLRSSATGILPDSAATLVNVQSFGSGTLELMYKTPAGRAGNELLHRHGEPQLEVVEKVRPWSLGSDDAFFRLVSDANRIHAVSLVEGVR